MGWGRGVDLQALADFRGDTLGTLRRHVGNIRATDGEGCGDSWGASFGRGATDGEVWCDTLGTLGVFVRKYLTKQRFSRGFCGALVDQRRTSVGRWRRFDDAAICLTVSALAASGDKRGGFAVAPCVPITTNREVAAMLRVRWKQQIGKMIKTKNAVKKVRYQLVESLVRY